MSTKWDSAFADRGWLSIFLANHDPARMVSRYASYEPEYRKAAAKLLNTFLLSMRGTPYCYYGDELGMSNPGFETIDQYKDVKAINMYKKTKNANGNLDQFLAELKFSSRDNGRTPMQWDSTRNADFSGVTPWIDVNANYTDVNVAMEERNPMSVLNHFRALTELRKSNAALVCGQYNLLLKDDPSVYSYTRTLGTTRMLVILNFSKSESVVKLDELTSMKSKLINNYEGLKIDGGSVRLEPYQAVIVNY